MSVRVFAPAKINLTLRVGRPRADGLHPLESIVAFAADAGDYVEAAPAENLSLRITGPFAEGLAADESNLVLRAARALAEASGREAKAAIALEKNLPVASGIGGGSADAAATLQALNQVWGIGWSAPQLAALGAQLGADVPVFSSSQRAALLTGIGDVCEPFETPALDAVLVNPLAPLPTPEVYRRFDQMQLGSVLSGGERSWTTQAQALSAITAAGNDLLAPARALAPVLDEMAATLHALPQVQYAGLSGSGATMFGLCNDRAGAESVAGEMKRLRPAWWVQPVRLGGA